MVKKLLAVALGLLLSASAYAANDLDNKPIIFDTAGATSAITENVTVQTIVWYGASSTDDIVLHDASGGSVVFQSIFASEPQVVYFGPNGVSFKGLYLTTIDGGELLIYPAQ